MSLLHKKNGVVLTNATTGAVFKYDAIAIATFGDWLKKLAPVFLQPIRSETKTDRTLNTRFEEITLIFHHNRAANEVS